MTDQAAEQVAPASLVVAQTECRLCGHTLVTRDPVLDLGDHCVSTFPPMGDTSELLTAPLALAACEECGLVQLTHTVDGRMLFRDQYWYASGINGLMREELRNVVREARMWTKVHDGDWVLDIGANDGTLLSAWREHLHEGKPYRMAIEPSPTFADILSEVAEAVVTDVFPCPAIEGAGKFRVITSIAMFYAVPNPVAFAQAVRNALTDDGVWVVQMQDLYNMVDRTAFDNICHEHLAYYTVETFAEVCRLAGLQVVSVQPREINGGSLRFIVQKVGTGLYHAPPIVTPTIYWDVFSSAIDARVANLQATVDAARYYGHTVDLLGASTKGNTLLQVAKLGPDKIRCCWERHPGKMGRTTITGIPILHEEHGRRNKPDLLVCPIWQFRSGLIEREHKYLAEGGKIYFPLPDGELYQGGN